MGFAGMARGMGSQHLGPHSRAASCASLAWREECEVHPLDPLQSARPSVVLTKLLSHHFSIRSGCSLVVEAMFLYIVRRSARQHVVQLIAKQCYATYRPAMVSAHVPAAKLSLRVIKCSAQCLTLHVCLFLYSVQKHNTF